jgi:hypothetical protein
VNLAGLRNRITELGGTGVNVIGTDDTRTARISWTAGPSPNTISRLLDGWRLLIRSNSVGAVQYNSPAGDRKVILDRFLTTADLVLAALRGTGTASDIVLAHDMPAAPDGISAAEQVAITLVCDHAHTAPDQHAVIDDVTTALREAGGRLVVLETAALLVSALAGTHRTR